MITKIEMPYDYQNAVIRNPVAMDVLGQEEYGKLRCYVSPAGRLMPGVTTYLRNTTSSKALFNWKKKNIKKGLSPAANHEQNRGKEIHSYVEKRLFDKTYAEYFDENCQQFVDQVTPYIDSVDPESIVAVECNVYDPNIPAAGTPDAIIKDDLGLLVYDWKTSSKMKAHQYLEDYFIQVSVYAKLFNLTYADQLDELYNGARANRVRIVLVVPDDIKVISLYPQDIEIYYQAFLERVKLFNQYVSFLSPDPNQIELKS